jgi:hypothetical protein
MLAQNNTTDFLEFVKTSYEKISVNIDPNNPDFWNRYKMKNDFREWKGSITVTFWEQYSKGCGGSFEQILSLNIIDEYYNTLLDDYEELFDEVTSKIFIKMYNETNS